MMPLRLLTLPALFSLFAGCTPDKWGSSWDSAETGCDSATFCSPVNYDANPTDVTNDPFDVTTLKEHVGFLASWELEGRAPGTSGDALAIEYIEEGFSSYGLAAPAGGFTQSFVDTDGNSTKNVAGVLWGSDDSVADEMIVVLAHHDHLGVDYDGIVYRGADDNASGVAGLLALADAFSRDAPLRRTLVFLSTSSEEINLDGAYAWIDDPPSDLPIRDTAFAVNLDMIGRYDYEGLVYLLNASRGSPGREALDAVSDDHRSLDVDTDYTASMCDLDAFCEVSIPGIMMFTEDPVYHSGADVPARLDYGSLSDITSLTASILRELADGNYGLAEWRDQGCDFRR